MSRYDLYIWAEEDDEAITYFDISKTRVKEIKAGLAVDTFMTKTVERPSPKETAVEETSEETVEEKPSEEVTITPDDVGDASDVLGPIGY